MKVNRQDSLNNEYLVSRLIEGSRIPILRQISIVSDDWSPCASKPHSARKQCVTWDQPQMLKQRRKSPTHFNPTEATTEGEISGHASRREDNDVSRSPQSRKRRQSLRVSTLGFRPSSFTKCAYEDSPELKNPIPHNFTSELEAKSRELFQIQVCPVETNETKDEQIEKDSLTSESEQRSLFMDHSFEQSSNHDCVEMNEEEEARLMDELLYKITLQQPEQIIDDIINLVENKPAVLYPQRQSERQKGKRTLKQVQYLVKQYYKCPEWSRTKGEEIGKAIGLNPASVLKWRQGFIKKQKEARDMLLCFQAAAQGLL